MQPLIDGIALELQRPAGDTVRGAVARAVQRHWSRVGVVQLDASSTGRLFVKQFVDRSGRWLPVVYADELAGVAVASLLTTVTTLRPEGTRENDLIIAYPHVDLVPFDELLRRDSHRFASVWPGVCEQIRALVSELTQLARRDVLSTLPRKEAALTGTPCVSFKGLELRNLAVASDRDEFLYFFDVGRPFVTSTEHVVAQLLTSAIFLNWGWPLSRFVAGPPRGIAGELWRALDPDVDVEVVKLEVDKIAHQKLRILNEPSAIHRYTRSAALRLLGTPYWWRAKLVIL